MKRKSIFLGTLILAVLFACTAFGAEYTADMITTGPHGNSTGKLYVKGNLFRQDIAMQGQEQTILINEETGDTIVVMHAQKMYMEFLDMADEEFQETMEVDIDSAEELLEENPDMATAEDLGTETVNGYKCKVFKVTYKEDLRGDSTLWISKKLETPIKIVTNTSEGTSTMEMKNIQEGSLASSLFEIPQGYKKMEMPGFMGDMDTD
ncbi:MAG TPA: DUF4412 domain-containing protein [Synergistaceae bacterium]|nr:DUF4412 domain-containing protein [Synergistaceae bacterium]HPQ38612.1 DUF4412 domain-containing protein [Synergistaceae bacterium]